MSIGEFQTGQMVEGVVAQVRPWGVYIQLDVITEGRVLLSEMNSPPDSPEVNPYDLFKLGQIRKFRIIEILRHAEVIMLSEKRLAEDEQATG